MTNKQDQINETKFIQTSPIVMGSLACSCDKSEETAYSKKILQESKNTQRIR